MDILSFLILVGFTSFFIAALACLIIICNTGSEIKGLNMFMAWAIFMLVTCIFALICVANCKDYEVIHRYNIVSHNNEDYYVNDDNKIVTVNLNSKDRYYTDEPSYVEFKQAKFLWFTDTKVTYYINMNE